MMSMKMKIETAWQAILATAGRSQGAAGVDLEAAMRDRTAIEPAALQMLECLLPLARSLGPLVIGQIGQSLDGRICTETGDSHYVNGDAALVHLHRLRALVDCVLVGVGTMVADRPQLTVRHVPGPDPVRAVLDPRGRAPAGVSPLAPAADAAPTLHLVDAARIDRLDPPAAHVQRVPLRRTGDGAADHDAAGGVAPCDVLAALAGVGCRRVLVEGGSTTLSHFFDAGALDRLHVLVAPLLIGSGRPGLSLAPVQRLRDVPRPPMRRYLLGEDTLFDIEL